MRQQKKTLKATFQISFIGDIFVCSPKMQKIPLLRTLRSFTLPNHDSEVDMKLLSKAFFTIAASTAMFSSLLEAGYVIQNGSLVNEKYAPTMSYLEHYTAACQAFNTSDWKEAHRHFYIVSSSFNNCPLASEAHFYLGVCYFNMDEFDIANAAFDDYLSSTNNPQYFELAFGYKFAIAEQFRCGSRRRFCGSRKLPKWACGRELAVRIYNEVISSLPSHEYAVSSLYSKGWLLWEDRDHKGAVEAFQSLVRRFPKHELTPECYILINHVYLDQSLHEFQNPDILALAEINTQRFIRAFPKEDRIWEAETLVQCITEVNAKGLYDIAVFYETTNKPRAAIIYYQHTIARFPKTAFAREAAFRLECLRPDCFESLIPRNYYETDSAECDADQSPDTIKDESMGESIDENRLTEVFEE
jgi:outer membrane protein assembly factor BamD (BamD/ComL family)